VSTATPTLDGFVHWAASRGYATSTVDGHAAVITRWKRSRMEPLAWLVAQQEASRSRSTNGLPTASVKRYQQALQAWFEYSTGQRPSWVLPRYVRRAKPQPAAVLTITEEQAVRAALRPETGPREPQGGICRLLLATGARVGEVTGLRLDEVETQPSGVILVHFMRTKTRVPRAVPLLPADAADLAGYLAGGRPTSRSRWVFPSPHNQGRKAMSDASVRGFLAMLGAELGIERLHPHAFRHLVATRMTEAGVAPDIRMAVLGQTSRGVAQGYQHPGAESLRTALAAGRRGK